MKSLRRGREARHATLRMDHHQGREDPAHRGQRRGVGGQYESTCPDPETYQAQGCAQEETARSRPGAAGGTMKTLIIMFIIPFSGGLGALLLAKWSNVYTTDWAYFGLVGPVIITVLLTWIVITRQIRKTL